jgi:hypothetical protein
MNLANLISLNVKDLTVGASGINKSSASRFRGDERDINDQRDTVFVSTRNIINASIKVIHLGTFHKLILRKTVFDFYDGGECRWKKLR